MPTYMIAEEFKDKLTDFLTGEKGQKKIKQAIAQKDIGMISRLFNEMSLFSSVAKKSTLDEAISAQSNNELQEYVSSVIIEMSQSLIDSSQHDLTEKAKGLIGADNYEQLLLLCDNNPQQLINYFLQASATLYTMIITEEHNDRIGMEEMINEDGYKICVDKNSKGTLTETQRKQMITFQSDIYIPLSKFTITLSTETLKKAPTQELDVSEELKQYYVEWSNIISHALTDLNSLSTHYLLPDKEKQTLIEIIEVFNKRLENITEYCDKFEMGLTLSEKECDDQITRSVFDLTAAMAKMPDLTERYIKKSWVDKFWDLVSAIMKRDWKTQSSKDSEASIRLTELPKFVAEKSRSRQSSKASSTESIEEIIKPNEPETK